MHAKSHQHMVFLDVVYRRGQENHTICGACGEFLYNIKNQKGDWFFLPLPIALTNHCDS